jgi:hypothetical protein
MVQLPWQNASRTASSNTAPITWFISFSRESSRFDEKKQNSEQGLRFSDHPHHTFQYHLSRLRQFATFVTARQ